MLAWSSLRSVPLWRAALEPTIGALVGAALGMATGSEALFLLGTVAGLALPAWRLNRVYREVPRLDAATASEGLPLEP
ncbi:MAG: hypothetical protein IPG05_09945 [Gemmatimonadetes bacterium]|nr:hypothetical protein [Gemmatimonadota bacterium]